MSQPLCRGSCCLPSSPPVHVVHFASKSEPTVRNWTGSGQWMTVGGGTGLVTAFLTVLPLCSICCIRSGSHVSLSYLHTVHSLTFFHCVPIIKRGEQGEPNAQQEHRRKKVRNELGRREGKEVQWVVSLVSLISFHHPLFLFVHFTLLTLPNLHEWTDVSECRGR